MERGSIMKAKKCWVLVIVGVFICGFGIITVSGASWGETQDKAAPPAIPSFKRPQPFGYREGTDLVSDFQMVTVMSVIDGDTIVVKQYGVKKTIRFIGVNTAEPAYGQYYAKEATTFMRNLLKGEKVYLKTDSKSGSTDKHGRTLAYVYRMPDGLFVNAELIRQGYSPAYLKFPFEQQPKFYELEEFAKFHKKGIWASVSQE